MQSINQEEIMEEDIPEKLVDDLDEDENLT